MSKSSNTRQNICLLFVACVALVCADLVVSSAHSQPQNANDETTRGATMTSNSNGDSTNTSKSKSRRRSRRNRTKANANMSGDTGNANMTGDTTGGQDTNANMTGDTSASMTGNANMGRRRGRRRGRRNRATAATMEANANTSDTMNMSSSSSSGGVQTDLSGTYTGNVNYPEGGLNGPATIVVTGNQFVLTPDGGGSPVNGTVTAVTTRGYTGVTMMFGDRTQIPSTQSPPPLPAVSLRARMSGGRVTLMSVPGEKRQFSFAATGASGTGRVRTRSKRRMRNRAARATSTDTDRGMDTGTAIKPPTKSTP